MTPALQSIFDISTRIREYEAAADTITAMARLCTDVQVRASLQQVALDLVQTAGQWRVRQDADLVETKPSAVDPTSKAPAWRDDGIPVRLTWPGTRDDPKDVR